MRFFLVPLALVLVVGCAETQSQPPATAQTATSPASEVVTEMVPASPSVTKTPVPVTSESVTQTVFVIDVRSDQEFNEEHIDGAIHIPHTQIAERIAEVTDDKDARIILYCAVGGRAGRAKGVLDSMGFKNVENGGGLSDMKSRDNSYR